MTNKRPMTSAMTKRFFNSCCMKRALRFSEMCFDFIDNKELLQAHAKTLLMLHLWFAIKSEHNSNIRVVGLYVNIAP